MGLLNHLQKMRDGVSGETLHLDSINQNVELLPLFMSQRIKLIREVQGENEREASLMLIALSLAENGQRLADSIDLDELIAYIDPLPDSEIALLFKTANALSKITIGDVEDAQKNS